MNENDELMKDVNDIIADCQCCAGDWPESELFHGICPPCVEAIREVQIEPER